MRYQHEQEFHELSERLRSDKTLVKIKPKAKVKELQTQEKLIAIQERYGEAQHIRNELKTLEQIEENRVNKLKEMMIFNKEKELQMKQENERKQLEIKIATNQNKLKIKQQKDLEVLYKQINLHHNDIMKYQNQASKAAKVKGDVRDELRRFKVTSSRINQYIAESRKVLSIGKSTARAKTATSGDLMDSWDKQSFTGSIN